MGIALTIVSTAATHKAQEAFDALWDRVQNDLPIEEADIDGALRIAKSQKPIRR